MSQLTHSYGTLLSTLHERSSLLAAPSATIPPSVNRTLKRQIEAFARALQQDRSEGRLDRRDAQTKWERIEESLQGDEEGRRLLLAAKDNHPVLNELTEAEEEAQPSPPAAGRSSWSANPASDEPYRDSAPASPRQSNSELMQSQRQIFRDQDSQLDTLSLSIGRQHEMGLRMNEELELHGELLDDLDQGVESTGLRLGRASGQLTQVSRKIKDHGSLCVLFGLIILLITLIILFK